MAKDELSSFRIGDLRRPVVRTTGSKGSAQPRQETPEEASIGFYAIEERLESSSVELLAEELRDSYEKLEALAQGREMRKKAAAKKAMVAYERTADLFEYLFQTKDALQDPKPD